MKLALYSFTPLTCLLVLAIVFHKVLSKKLNDPVTKSFLLLICTSIIFCFNDNFFGYFFLNLSENNLFLVSLTTYLYYFLGSVTAYLWAVFMNTYISEKLGRHSFFSLTLLIPLILVTGLLISNFTSHIIFSIDSNNSYVKGPFKNSIYILDLVYFVLIIIQGTLKYFKTVSKELKNKFRYVYIFSVIPFISLLLQIFISGAPFYTIGLTISVLIIFCYISTSHFENITVLKHEINNIKQIKETEKIIFSVANTYLSMHNFFLKENRYVPYKSMPFIDSFLRDPENAQDDINRVMEGLTTPQYRNKVLDFIKIDTVSERLGPNNEISVEFLGNHSGWCVASWIRVENDSDGKCIQAVFAVRRIDEEKRREIEFEKKFKQAIMNENEIFGEILHNQSTGTIVVNSNNQLIALNTAAKKYLSLANKLSDNLTLYTVLETLQSENKANIIKKLDTIKVNGGFYTFEFESSNDENKISNFRADAKQLKLSNGEKVLIISITDITTNKAMERELLILSETDSLTGINNRGSGEQKTAELLRNGKKGMLCLLDANKFKYINDTFGHHVGDKVIIEIANALKRSFRDRDIVMRLGGDEFAMFAVGCVDSESGHKCMKRFFEHINSIHIPELKGHKVSVSVGCVLCLEPEKYSFDDYYQQADSAMYFSKANSGSSYTFSQF